MTVTTTGSQAWVDRKQAAMLACRSVDTIRRAERTYHLTKRIGRNGLVQLSVGELVAAKVVPLSALDPETSAARQVAVTTAVLAELEDLRRVRAELEDLRRTHAELAGRCSGHEQLVADLRAHLGTQADHIAVLRGGRSSAT